MSRREIIAYQYISFIILFYRLLMLFPFVKESLYNLSGKAYDVFLFFSILISLLSVWLILKGFFLFLKDFRQKESKSIYKTEWIFLVNKYDIGWFLLLSNNYTFPVFWYFYVYKKVWRSTPHIKKIHIWFKKTCWDIGKEREGI